MHEDKIEIVNNQTQEVSIIDVPSVAIREVIGAGANGIVFNGVDNIDREVAVKIYPPRARQSDNLVELRTKALGEVRKLATLKRTGLPTIYSLGQSEQTWPVVVMEYSGRRSIRDQRAQIMAKDSRYRSLVLSGVLGVLKYVEDSGVLHGDIHFGNILVDEDILSTRNSPTHSFDLGSNIEIIDFGTSLLAGQSSSEARHARLLKKFAYALLPELAAWCKPTVRLDGRTGSGMLPRLQAALTFYISAQLDQGPHVRIQGLPEPSTKIRPDPELLGLHLRELADFDLTTILSRLTERYTMAEMQVAKLRAVECLSVMAGLTTTPSGGRELDEVLIDLLRTQGFVVDEAARGALTRTQ